MMMMPERQNKGRLLTCKNSCEGAMYPELPTTGSRMMPAISPLLAANTSRTESRLLYWAVRVAAAQQTAGPHSPYPPYNDKENVACASQ